MKKLLLILIAALALSSVNAQQPRQNVTGVKADSLNEFTYATLPAAGKLGRIVIVTDALTAACTAGDGTIRCFLRDTGSGWEILAAVGGAASNLDSLSDVTVSSPITNDVLYYNGSTWVNTASVLKIASFEGASADGSTGSFSLDKCAGLTAGATAVVTGTNQTLVSLDLDAATDEGGCGSFVLPTGVTAIDVSVEARAAEAGTNVARISVSNVCVEAGASLDTAFSNVNTFAWTNTGLNQRVTATQTSLTITGCAATERFYFKFFRDGDGTSGTDSLGVDLRVVAVRFSVR